MQHIENFVFRNPLSSNLSLKMIAWIALLLIIPALSEGCGKRPLTRVIGGIDAAQHSWPWQVSLRKGGRHFCGGTLIRSDWVLTAAHCVYQKPDASAYTVVVGAHKRLGSTDLQEEIRLKKLIKHNGFTMQNLKHDIALLQLERPVKLSSKVNVACLPTKDVAEKAKCYITGWGRISGSHNRLPNILQQAALPAVSHEDCKKKYSRVDASAHLCAGTGAAAAAGGCNGDSGGPLVCDEGGRWTLHGAVSFGKRNCPTTHYTVFARVNSYMGWIKKHIDGVTPPHSPPPTGVPPPPPVTDKPPPPPPPGCKDIAHISICVSLKKRNLCNYPGVKRYCMKTCSDNCA